MTISPCKRIEMARQFKNVSKERMATVAEVSVFTYNRWIKDITEPTISQYIAMVNELDMTLNDVAMPSIITK